MGRPSVAAERRLQILEAALRCLAANGLAGTTLDGIAAEAGMARGHVRHFVGNRDAILEAAATLLYLGYVPEPEAEPGTPPAGSYFPDGTATLADALDYLFGGLAEPGPENIAALAFVEASRTNERIRGIIVGAYLTADDELREYVRAEAPEATEGDLARTSYGVLTIALGNTFLADIDFSAERTAVARRAAEARIDSLRGGRAGA